MYLEFTKKDGMKICLSFDLIKLPNFICEEVSGTDIRISHDSPNLNHTFELKDRYKDVMDLIGRAHCELDYKFIRRIEK